MRYLSVFSGIEAASAAWKPLGWEPLAFAEIDSFPCAVLEHHYPDVPNLGDVETVDWGEYRGAVDVLVGGSPCQSFSVAGGRDGLRGPSKLMFEYIRAVAETLPKWFVWENVPGSLSSEKGNAFRQLLSEMDQLGYGMAWRVLDARHFGIPQMRRRVFLVGHLGGPAGPCEVLFERKSLQGVPEKVEGQGEAAEPAVGENAGRSGGVMCISPFFPKRKEQQLPINEDGTSFALTTWESPLVLRTGEGQPRVVRHMTPVECERLQGFPDNYTRVPYRNRPEDRCPDTPRIKALGNSMAVPVMAWIGKRIEQADENWG